MIFFQKKLNLLGNFEGIILLEDDVFLYFIILYEILWIVK